MKWWETFLMFVGSPTMTPQKFAVQNLIKDTIGKEIDNINCPSDDEGLFVGQIHLK